MESRKISELEQYNGSANGFVVPGVADGETQKADLGAMVDKGAGAAGYVKSTDLKTVNGVSLTGQGDVALELANPFKGWFKTGDTLPTDGFDGAYLFFKDTSEQSGLTTIYRWNGTAYADTGTVVDTSNVNTFETGQAVNGVAIDGTGLANPAPNSLAKAGDVVRFVENTSEVAKKVDSLEFEAVSAGSVIPQLVDVANKYVVRSVITNSADGDTAFYISYLPVSEQQRLVHIKQVVRGSFSHPVGAVFLLDSPSEIVAGTEVNCIVAPVTANVDTDVVVTVPGNKILCVSRFKYNNRETLIADIVEWQSSTINELINDVGAIKEKTDKLATTYDYTDISSEAMTAEGNLGFAGISSTVIQSFPQSYWKIEYFPSRGETWRLRVEAVHDSSSTLSARIGCIFLVDDPSEIVAGLDVGASVLNLGIKEAHTSMDVVVDVPKNKYVAISYTTYYNPSINKIELYEADLTLQLLSDIVELQRNKLDRVQIGPDYVSAENPLEVIKETPGYTSIFRKMGVIGGSMSTGWHSHDTGSVSSNMPEYSYLQFMARLCRAEGFNFSRGGMSAKQWPQSDMIDNFYDANKKCQLYLVQLGNNDLTDHNNRLDCTSKTWYDLNWDGHDPDHGKAYPTFYDKVQQSGVTQNDWDAATQAQRLEWIGGPYNLGTTSDLTPTGGTSIADYTYNGTFYGNMARIINEIRKVQPRAYVFLSTFLKGYGSSPDGQPGGAFDYNGAIRNIVDYYSDTSNRPEGDELHYYLIDIYQYGKPYSFYNSGIHSGTVKGSHLVATGYNYWAYEFCTYIDWIIKNNMSEFNDVAFVGTDNYN